MEVSLYCLSLCMVSLCVLGDVEYEESFFPDMFVFSLSLWLMFLCGRYWGSGKRSIYVNARRGWENRSYLRSSIHAASWAHNIKEAMIENGTD